MSNLFVAFSALLSFIAIPASSLNLPSYIQKCNSKEPDFQKCALEKANLAVPYLSKGDRQYQVPSLSPLTVPFMQIVGGNFKINFSNVETIGLETSKITFMEFLEDKLSVKIRVERLQFIGMYSAFGKVLVDLEGAGKANITAVGGDYSYVTKLSAEERNGEEYLKVGEPVLDFKFERIYFWMENLISSEKLGIDINKILNDNWQEVYADLGKGIEETVKVIYKQVVSGIFKKVPRKYIL